MFSFSVLMSVTLCFKQENAPKKSMVDADSEAKRERTADFWKKLLYGIASATITVFFTNPLNVAQVRVQARSKGVRCLAVVSCICTLVKEWGGRAAYMRRIRCKAKPVARSLHFRCIHFVMPEQSLGSL